MNARSTALRGVALLVLLMGLGLAYGGALLALAGGSWYYLLSGLLSIGSGVLLWRSNGAGAKLFAALTLGTIAWAFWEAGADHWALLPRVWPFLLLWAILLLPPLRRPLGLPASGKAWALAIGAIILSGGIGLALHHATGMELRDPAYDRGMAAAPAPVPNAAATDWGGDWRHYGNDEGGSRFSPLDQINAGNVGKLEKAWTYRVGYGVDNLEANLEMTPLKVGNKVFICTPYNDIIALDPVSGKEIWRHRSGVDRKGWVYSNCRAVTYYEVPGATGVCAKRIISTQFGGWLKALDADTGQLCPGFGDGGMVDLRKGLTVFDHPGYYYPTSAPALAKGKVVLGGWIADGQHWGEPSGVIRAFDAVTGKLAWAWDMGRPERKGEPPVGEYYTPSTPNSWAPMSVDSELGLVYAPTGSTSGTDYYGANRRPFDEKYATSTVALDAETGEVRWSFQTTHHDIWDYDNPAQPSLVDIRTPEGIVKAVIQPTKRAQLFVLDRATGKPIKEVVERRVPQAGLALGDWVWPTQPYSVGMPDLGGPRLNERMMWGISPFDQLWCRLEFRRSRYEGDFTPPGEKRFNIVYPGYSGGQNWGMTSYDLDRGLLITASNRIANRVKLVPRVDAEHQGAVPMGKGSNPDIGGLAPQANSSFAAAVAPFLSPLFSPCQQPPYGTLTAIDLASGKVVWHHPVGSARAAGPLGIRSHIPMEMGMPMFGGPMVTRGGLTFMSATKDETFRAFDNRTGKTLWEAELPAGGQSGPMTYLGADGRQYVLIAAAGHYGTASKRGDYIIAYALPKVK